MEQQQQSALVPVSGTWNKCGELEERVFSKDFPEISRYLNNQLVYHNFWFLYLQM